MQKRWRLMPWTCYIAGSVSAGNSIDAAPTELPFEPAAIAPSSRPLYLHIAFSTFVKERWIPRDGPIEILEIQGICFENSSSRQSADDQILLSLPEYDSGLRRVFLVLQAPALYESWWVENACKIVALLVLFVFIKHRPSYQLSLWIMFFFFCISMTFDLSKLTFLLDQRAL